MITITNTRQAARDISLQIHNWRFANIQGYNAESWANCELPDAEFDSIYKHQTDELWFVPLDNNTPLTVDRIEDLPEGWRKPAETLPM